MRVLLSKLFILIFLSSCSGDDSIEEKKEIDSWKKIEFNDFEIQIPESYSVIEKGRNTYIRGDGVEIYLSWGSISINVIDEFVQKKSDEYEVSVDSIGASTRMIAKKKEGDEILFDLLDNETSILFPGNCGSVSMQSIVNDDRDEIIIEIYKSVRWKNS